MSRWYLDAMNKAMLALDEISAKGRSMLAEIAARSKQQDVIGGLTLCRLIDGGNTKNLSRNACSAQRTKTRADVIRWKQTEDTQ